MLVILILTNFDVHKSTVLRWENGETEKIKLPIIETLASFYNVNPTWLMGYDVPMEKELNDIMPLNEFYKDVVPLLRYSQSRIRLSCE